VVLGAAADAGSTAGTGGGVLTITFAATALRERYTHCERIRTVQRACFGRLTRESSLAPHHLVPCDRVPPVPDAP
jgi:hypothetical protein